jgi:hypothetical protein
MREYETTVFLCLAVNNHGQTEIIAGYVDCQDAREFIAQKSIKNIWSGFALQVKPQIITLNV